MPNKFSDMRDILVCFALAEEEGYGLPGFCAKVQVMPGMSVSRKIQALCYLFDNVLSTNASLSTALNRANQTIEVYVHSSKLEEEELNPVTKEDAFAALQMAITAASVNYQNGNNE